jgi:1,4-dihydroxy-2-naphthoate octaprenyltransferase
MFTRSTWLHLRIPFSFFLMPVFMFGLALSGATDWINILLIFLAVHLFLYPASNGYNSYFDKDEKSIGGLKNPPKVSLGLYRASLLFDGLALILGAFVSLEFAVMLFIYGLVSKAYSHPTIRLKKYPFLSWFVAGFFQGAFTFVMVMAGLKDMSILEMNWSVYHPALLSSAILWGSYPMTQVYQHEEDARRGDITLSIKLGIRGTFIFTTIVFGVATIMYWYFLRNQFDAMTAWLFVAAMVPVVGFFNWWFLKVIKDEKLADFTNTMRLNLISAICLHLSFGWLWLF